MMQWIPVGERLPDEYREVLIVAQDGQECVVTVGALAGIRESSASDGIHLTWQDRLDPYNDGQRFIGCEYGIICNVTHWMPLPEPPRSPQRDGNMGGLGHP